MSQKSHQVNLGKKYSSKLCGKSPTSGRVSNNFRELFFLINFRALEFEGDEDDDKKEEEDPNFLVVVVGDEDDWISNGF